MKSVKKTKSIVTLKENLLVTYNKLENLLRLSVLRTPAGAVGEAATSTYI